jgi:cysteine dioxygenase
MHPILSRLLAKLDEFAGPVPLHVLESQLSAGDLTLDVVRRFVRFGRERYQRNLARTGPAYEALVLCWQSGQRSPIHDHRGSRCAFRVLAGVAAETRFARTTDGLIYPVSTVDLAEGTICATQDDDIHQVSNLQPGGRNLVTLHIYSPPLRVFNVYSLTEPGTNEWIEPVDEFTAGLGI